VFDRGNERADVEVKKIIAANLGRRVGASGGPRPVAAAQPAAPTIAAAPASVAAR